MPAGGPRPGAGRPRGSKLDPRHKQLRAAVRARLVEVIDAGADPLSFLLDVIKDKSVDLPTRLHVAELLLPYVHPRQYGCPPQMEISPQYSAKMLDNPS